MVWLSVSVSIGINKAINCVLTHVTEFRLQRVLVAKSPIVDYWLIDWNADIYLPLFNSVKIYIK